MSHLRFCRARKLARENRRCDIGLRLPVRALYPLFVITWFYWRHKNISCWRIKLPRKYKMKRPQKLRNRKLLYQTSTISEPYLFSNNGNGIEPGMRKRRLRRWRKWINIVGWRTQAPVLRLCSCLSLRQLSTVILSSRSVEHIKHVIININVSFNINFNVNVGISINVNV